MSKLRSLIPRISFSKKPWPVEQRGSGNVRISFEGFSSLGTAMSNAFNFPSIK